MSKQGFALREVTEVLKVNLEEIRVLDENEAYDRLTIALQLLVKVFVQRSNRLDV